MFSKDQENRIIRGGIIVFWWFFWLFNVLDKVIGQTSYLWVGKDRLSQFSEYFVTIGITNEIIPLSFLIFVSVVQVIALIFITIALFNFFFGDEDKVHANLFMGILVSLFIFSFFAIGDQIFGDRVELLEHSIYWISFVLSWYVYTHSEKQMNFV